MAPTVAGQAHQDHRTSSAMRGTASIQRLPATQPSETRASRTAITPSATSASSSGTVAMLAPAVRRGAWRRRSRAVGASSAVVVTVPGACAVRGPVRSSLIRVMCTCTSFGGAPRLRASSSSTADRTAGTRRAESSGHCAAICTSTSVRARSAKRTDGSWRVVRPRTRSVPGTESAACSTNRRRTRSSMTVRPRPAVSTGFRSPLSAPVAAATVSAVTAAASGPSGVTDSVVMVSSGRGAAGR